MKPLKKLLESLQDRNRLTRALKARDAKEAMRAVTGRRPQDFGLTDNDFRKLLGVLKNADRPLAMDKAREIWGIPPNVQAQEPNVSGGDLKTIDQGMEELVTLLNTYNYVEVLTHSFDGHGEWEASVITDLHFSGDNPYDVIKRIVSSLGYDKDFVKSPSGKTVRQQDQHYKEFEGGYITVLVVRGQGPNMPAELRIGLNSWKGGLNKQALEKIKSKHIP